MANRHFDLENCRKNLLRNLNSKYNRDGYFEMLLSDFLLEAQKSDEINLEYLKKLLEPHGMRLYFYVSLLFENTGFKVFKKTLKDLLQDSIRKKVLSGTATYKYTFVVAEYASNSWLLPAYESKDTTSKVKSLYFYKFIDIMLRPKSFITQKQCKCFITQKQRKNILKRYMIAAKKPQKIIIDFFTDPTNTLNTIDSISKETILQNALKHSF